MAKLTQKQKRFADYYIKSANATDAAIRAGYSKRSAQQMGAENLSKPVIKAYIDKRIEKADRKRIADADEVLEFLTSTLRGEIPDNNCRIRAADLLGKRYNIYNKAELDIKREELKIKREQLEINRKKANQEQINQEQVNNNIMNIFELLNNTTEREDID